MSNQDVAVVIVAAGSGSRLGQPEPKAFVEIAGRSLVERAAETVFGLSPGQVVVVAPSSHVERAREQVVDAAATASVPVTVVAGGATRQESVASGLAVLDPAIEVVLVHDAARAFAPADVFERVINAVRDSGAGVVPARAVIDTIKRVEGREVVAAVDRATLAAAQTPQGFARHPLDAAYAAATEEYTDDTALFAAAGHRIVTVEGDERAFKVTRPEDLARAEAAVRGGVVAGLPRVGFGSDVHAFGGDGELWLAGLHWPGERALSGHSDGDAVAHAIVDALLSAAGLGDIGTHFGVDRPEFAGAHADAFLARTRTLLAEAGFAIGNVSVQVQANRPRFSARRVEAERVLSAALGAPVSVAATTTDGLGFTGEGSGVQAFAVALIHSA